jgi:hypothetical protein
MRNARTHATHREVSPAEFGIARVTSLLSVHAFVNRGNLADPTAPVPVFQVQNRVERPMKVVREEGYLPVEQVQGVARNPPTPLVSRAGTPVSDSTRGLGLSSPPTRLIRL